MKAYECCPQKNVKLSSNKMKSQLLKAFGATLLALSLAGAVSAVPITGNFGLGGGTLLLNAASTSSATGVITWSGSPDSTTFSASTPGTTLNASNNTPANLAGLNGWSFNSGAVNNFFSVGTFTFNLLSSGIQSQGGGVGSGFVTVQGLGNMTSSVAGQDPTLYSFRMTINDPDNGTPSTFTFSASGAPVPDGGTSAILLSVALLGLGLFTRRSNRS